MKKWIAVSLAAVPLILWLRGRGEVYAKGDLLNLFWDADKGRWRTDEEVAALLEEHPELLPEPLSSSEAAVLQYSNFIISAANKYSLDPGLIAAIIHRESNGDTYAVGSVGEIGLMQIRPSTAKWLGYTGDATDLHNPGTNIHIGAQYLRYQLDRYDGDVLAAISAYNQGTAWKDANGLYTNRKYVDYVYDILMPRYQLLILRAQGINPGGLIPEGIL